jgi:uncharacterized phiE125 gp8 family phage protein
MIGKWKLATAPTVEPLTLADAKGHLRLDSDADDALVATLITAARQMCEQQTWRALVTQTWDLLLEDWPIVDYIAVPRPPLLTVTSVTYRDEDGNTTTLSASAYRVETAYEPGRIVLKPDVTWPSVTLDTGLPITVRYTCGYGATAGSVPEPLRQGMRLVLGHLYENREAVVVSGFQAVKVPLTVEWLWQPYEVRW